MAAEAAAGGGVREQPARALFAAARDGGYALAAFNVNNLETAQAVIAAAEASAAPVVLQVSPGAIAYAGYKPLSRLAMDLADGAAVPVIVHLDHCRDAAVVERAIEDGYDSVMFDGSPLEFDENVRVTARLVEVARRRAGVAVEGELGVIGGSEDTDPDAAARRIVEPAKAAAYAVATGIDIIAPALGNLHRMPDDSMRLDVGLVRDVAAATGLPIALHGASGIARDQLPELVAAGITKVNISSRMSRALAAGIRESWANDGEAVDLRRFLGAGRDRIRDMAIEYLSLTGSAGRAATSIERTAQVAGGWEVE
jgi:ketose-bisphosphate aldolase